VRHITQHVAPFVGLVWFSEDDTTFQKWAGIFQKSIGMPSGKIMGALGNQIWGFWRRTPPHLFSALVLSVGYWEKAFRKGGLARHYPSAAGKINARGESHQELSSSLCQY
jgi:hypothetical protein